MPRRKQLIFKIQDLKCAVHIIEELSKLPQLNNFDMKSIELTIKENKPAPQILKKDIDTLVDRLQRGFSANKHKLTDAERLLFDNKYSSFKMDESYSCNCEQVAKGWSDKI